EKMPAPGGGSGWSVGGLGGEGAVAIPGEAAVAIPIGEVEPRAERRLATGIGELDRVLGGGLVPGCGVLLAGEPGIGKSTLLLQAAQSLSLAGERFLYVSGEESAAQVKLRADRLGESGEELYLLAECELERIEEQIVKLRPAALGVDSVQAVRWHQLPSSAGSVLQVREVAARLITLGRRAGFPLLLVGHVTKEGTVAGPRVLEHMVDGVLSFEGERTHGLRVLRARKNRFGSTQEVGLFDMRAGGLFEVENPSHLLLGERRGDAPGSATAAILEGSRPLLVEVQSLVSPTAYGSPARRVSGIDPGRLSMLSAVLEKRLGLPLGDKDIYANVVGGVRVQNTAADLALAAALISSLADRPIPAERVFTGEVGLLGEVRPVPGLSHRMEEAARLGFTSAWIPEGSLPEAPPAGLALRELRDLGDLLRCLEE
ncbi:MAG: DNA repair protein RadA, partial [Planctomycetota bacterium]